MSVRGVRLLALAFFLLFAFAVTWPGYLPFNRIHPLVLGLPFSLVWVAAWVLASMGVLWLVDRVETRERRPPGDEDA